MRRTSTKLVAVLVLAALCGCLSLSRADKEFVGELESYGIEPDEQAIKNPRCSWGSKRTPRVRQLLLGSGWR